MKYRLVLLLLIAFLFICPFARPDPGYLDKNRVQYIQKTLNALQTSDRNTLINTHNYIQVIESNTCRSAFADLKTNCLLEAAKRNCYQRRGGRKARNQCRLISDIVVTNKLGEKEFIDAKARYRIMKNNNKYRPAMLKELHRRYAELVVEFGLSVHFRHDNTKLASGIDKYCQQTTLKRGLSWQYCVAAVVWFIGTNEHGSLESD